jgi:hypothetical protein
MWPDGIVVAAPAFDQHLDLAKRREHFTIEQLAPEPGFEALAVGVLSRAAWLDEQRLLANPTKPAPSRFGG